MLFPYFLCVKFAFCNKISKITETGAILPARLLTVFNQLYIINIYSINGGEGVNVLIDNKSGAPIYDQIYAQIKSQIISGALKQDEMLPSIRGLAKDLRISLITTKRAYEELEKEGFIYTLPGKGCYVAPKNVELLREENLKKIESYLDGRQAC